MFTISVLARKLFLCPKLQTNQFNKKDLSHNWDPQFFSHWCPEKAYTRPNYKKQIRTSKNKVCITIDRKKFCVLKFWVLNSVTKQNCEKTDFFPNFRRLGFLPQSQHVNLSQHQFFIIVGLLIFTKCWAHVTWNDLQVFSNKYLLENWFSQTIIFQTGKRIHDRVFRFFDRNVQKVPKNLLPKRNLSKHCYIQ